MYGNFPTFPVAPSNTLEVRYDGGICGDSSLYTGITWIPSLDACVDVTTTSAYTLCNADVPNCFTCALAPVYAFRPLAVSLAVKKSNYVPQFVLLVVL